METPTATRDAIILAAGGGTRLVNGAGVPKPLVEVGGRALLDHVLLNLESAGFDRALVVIGHSADAVRRHRYSTTRIAIEWIVNPDYHRGNGTSLLCARSHARAPFALLMADHLIAPDVLARLQSRVCPPQGCLVAIDRHLDEVFDLDDAMKVSCPAERLDAIGKHLTAYDSIDIGLSLCDAAIFDAMSACAAAGQTELAASVDYLAHRGAARGWDVSGAAWIDVDTPGSLAEARRLTEHGCFRHVARVTDRAS
jgi:choline kinase